MRQNKQGENIIKTSKNFSVTFCGLSTYVLRQPKSYHMGLFMGETQLRELSRLISKVLDQVDKENDREV